MSEVADPEIPAQTTVPAPKKVRKPRTPKAKPVKKPRVGLGPIFLATSGDVNDAGNTVLYIQPEQPPAEIAHDVVKVKAWANTVPNFVGLNLLLVRQYNVILKVTKSESFKASFDVVEEKQVTQ